MGSAIAELDDIFGEVLIDVAEAIIKIAHTVECLPQDSQPLLIQNLIKMQWHIKLLKFKMHKV